jgi:hypothetical protein
VLQAQLLLFPAGSSLYPVETDLNIDWPVTSLAKLNLQNPSLQRDKRQVLMGEWRTLG